LVPKRLSLLMQVRMRDGVCRWVVLAMMATVALPCAAALHAYAILHTPWVELQQVDTRKTVGQRMCLRGVLMGGSRVVA
jgi:hypothetical protein